MSDDASGIKCDDCGEQITMIVTRLVELREQGESADDTWLPWCDNSSEYDHHVGHEAYTALQCSPDCHTTTLDDGVPDAWGEVEVNNVREA